MAEAERGYYVKAGSKKVKKLDDPMARMEEAAERGDVVIARNDKEEAALRKASRDAERMGKMKDAETVVDVPKGHAREMPVAKPEEIRKETERRVAEQRMKIQHAPKIDQKAVGTQVIRREHVRKPEPKPEPKKGFWDRLFRK